jgi:hypothetical protein
VNAIGGKQKPKKLGETIRILLADRNLKILEVQTESQGTKLIRETSEG